MGKERRDPRKEAQEPLNLNRGLLRFWCLAGRCFITQTGFHPGLPAAFVRAAGPEFTPYRRTIIGMAMSARMEEPEAMYEIIDYLDGTIAKPGFWMMDGISSRPLLKLPRIDARDAPVDSVDSPKAMGAWSLAICPRITKPSVRRL